MKIKKAFVTGGAGFVGSHVAARLVELGVEVLIGDNLSTGFFGNIPTLSKLLEVDFSKCPPVDLALSIQDCDAIFHFQANADVRGGQSNSNVDFEQNVVATHCILEAARIVGIKTFAFASSATVYGEPNIIPTKESFSIGPQTSHYGASKLACEKMVEAYASYSDMQTFSFRFPSIVGERYTHGVIIDICRKLKANPFEIELLGDGQQMKSYIYIGDVVNGIFTALENATDKCSTFNVGNDYWMTVDDLAKLVMSEMKIQNTVIKYRGGERGWIGDSPVVLLDSSSLKKLGWKTRTPIADGIVKTVQYLLHNQHLLR